MYRSGIYVDFDNIEREVVYELKKNSIKEIFFFHVYLKSFEDMSVSFVKSNNYKIFLWNLKIGK